jgi:hypothetical protein
MNKQHWRCYRSDDSDRIRVAMFAHGSQPTAEGDVVEIEDQIIRTRFGECDLRLALGQHVRLQLTSPRSSLDLFATVVARQHTSSATTFSLQLPPRLRRSGEDTAHALALLCNRRRAVRLQLAQPPLVRAHPPANCQHPGLTARLRDVSPMGVGLLLQLRDEPRMALYPKLNLQILDPDCPIESLLVVIRNARYDDDGWVRYGCELADPFTLRRHERVVDWLISTDRLIVPGSGGREAIFPPSSVPAGPSDDEE